MSKVLCYSVRLESLVSISDKAYLAKSFNGSEDIIPKSQVFGQDFGVTKSEAYWIAAWILEKKNIQYSCKKKAWVDSETLQIKPHITFERHIPKREEAKKPKINNELKR